MMEEANVANGVGNFLLGAGALAGKILTFPTDSAQAIDYYYSTSPASGLYIDVVGFYISR